jgi:predicted transcriptional regulator
VDPHVLRQHQFVEGFSMLLEARGLQRMAGRVFAWLLICEPAVQSSAALAESLHASRGAVSTALQLLLQTGLLHRVRRPGDRNLYVEVAPGAFTRSLEADLKATVVARGLLEEGLALLADAPPARRARLEEGRRVFQFFERELPQLVLRFIEEERRAGAFVTTPAPSAANTADGPSNPIDDTPTPDASDPSFQDTHAEGEPASPDAPAREI